MTLLEQQAQERAIYLILQETNKEAVLKDFKILNQYKLKENACGKEKNESRSSWSDGI